MGNKFFLTAAALCLAMIPGAAFTADDRDPFVPYSASQGSSIAAPSAEGDDTMHAQMNFPVASYRLVGIVIAPKESLAVVRGKDGRDYFLTKGDKLGKENGVVEEIKREGITVRIGESTVDMMVSNKMENAHETAQ